VVTLLPLFWLSSHVASWIEYDDREIRGPFSRAYAQYQSPQGGRGMQPGDRRVVSSLSSVARSFLARRILRRTTTSIAVRVRERRSEQLSSAAHELDLRHVVGMATGSVVVRYHYLFLLEGLGASAEEPVARVMVQAEECV